MPNEYAGDHGKPFPVLLPELQDLTFGGFWSGSPFLGSLAALPPGEGGMNPMAASSTCGTATPRRKWSTTTSSPAG